MSLPNDHELSEFAEKAAQNNDHFIKESTNSKLGGYAFVHDGARINHSDDSWHEYGAVLPDGYEITAVRDASRSDMQSVVHIDEVDDDEELGRRHAQRVVDIINSFDLHVAEKGTLRTILQMHGYELEQEHKYVLADE